MERSERRRRAERARRRIDTLYLLVRARGEEPRERLADRWWYSRRHHERWARLGHPCGRVDQCDWCRDNKLRQAKRESLKADSTGEE